MQFFTRRWGSKASTSTHKSQTTRQVPLPQCATAVAAVPNSSRSTAAGSNMGLFDRVKKGKDGAGAGTSRPTTSSVATRATTVSCPAWPFFGQLNPPCCVHTITATETSKERLIKSHTSPEGVPVSFLFPESASMVTVCACSVFPACRRIQ